MTYHVSYDKCEHCGRTATLKLGTFASGWFFCLYVYPKAGLNNLEDWKKLLKQPNVEIANSKGIQISRREMTKIISTPNYFIDRIDPSWEGYELVRVNGGYLHRLKVDGKYCLGHGRCWSYIVGEKQ